MGKKKNILKVVACVHALAHFLGNTGKYVKIKDLSKLNLKFDEEEIRKTKEELEKLDIENDTKSKPLIVPPSFQDNDVNEEEESEEKNKKKLKN